MPDTTGQGVDTSKEGSSAAGQGENTTKTGESQQKAGEGQEANKDSEQKPEILDDSKYETPTRANAKPWSNREERREFFAKLHKDKQATGEEENKGQEDGANGEEPDEDTPITRKQLKEQMEAVFQPVFDQIRSAADETEITQFLSKSENAQFKKYERLARKDMKVYPNVPIDRIFRALAFDDAQALGAEKGKQSEDKAKRNRIGGSSSRPSSVSGAPDFSKMSSKELQDFNQEIRSGKTVKVEED